jgi:hypothetical protein
MRHVSLAAFSAKVDAGFPQKMRPPEEAEANGQPALTRL